MKRKRLLAMVLVVCMVLTLLPGVALAEGTGGVTGTGTADDPYKIGSEADLFYFAQNLGGSVRGGTLDTEINKTKIYTELTADITLEGAWEPINSLEQGTFTHQYLIFDGKDHTISGMKVTATDINSGFFGKIGNSNLIDIKNLTINNATIALTQDSADADLGAGAFIGWCETSGASLTNCKLTNSTVSGGKNTGGLIGYIDYGEATITNCTVQDSTINAGARPAGGMVGYCAQNLTVSGGSVTGCTINYDSSIPTYTAGGQIIGRANHDMTFTKVEVSANTGTNLAAETLYGWAGSGITVTVEHDVAKIDESAYSTLEAAVAEAQTGDTVTLINDVTLPSTVLISDGRTITLDLNGKTISSEVATAIKLNKGTLNVADTAEVKGGISVLGEAFQVQGVGVVAAGDAILNIAEGVNVTSAEDCCVYIKGLATLNTAGNLTSNGAYAPIQGQGNPENNGTVINITGGSVTATAANKVAIYVPQLNTMTISGGTITGSTAIYVKSGNLTISGGTIIGNGALATYKYDGSAAWPTGEALVIDNCGYPGGAPVVSVTGGTFNSTNAAAVGSYHYGELAPLAGFITGGMYGPALSDTLVAVGYQYNSSTKCVIPTNAAASIGDVAYTSLASAVNAAKYGETIDLLADNTEALTVSKVITIKLNGYTVGAVLAGEGFTKNTTKAQLDFSVSSEGATVVSVAVENEIGDGVSPEDTERIAEVINLTRVNGVSDALGETGTESILSAADITPDDDDQVVVDISVAVTATESDLASGTLTFTAIPAANVYLNGVEHSSVPMSNDYLNGSEIQVLLPLPEGFEPKEIVHESSDGSSERFLESVAYPSAAKTFVIETINGYRFAKLIITKFSTFTMTSDEPVVTLLDITDAIAPINGGTPATVIAETDQYTGTVTWADASDVPVTQFTPSQTYTATIELTAKSGYTFEGVAANAFKVPCAMAATNGSDSGVITATFNSPPDGYITDGNGMMAFCYNGSLDIQGTYNGQWQKTTYGNGGYGTSFRFGDEDPVGLSIISASPVDVGRGITIGFEPKFYSSGRFLRIVYTLHNSGSETQTVSFGSHADTQIGNDDGATITKFDDARGFKMVNSNYPAQFNFFGKETIGVTDVDTYWFGYYYDRYNNVFNQIGDPRFSGDSGMAYSWQNKTLAPGQTRTFSVLIGIGDALSVENVPIGVNFDSQGGSDVDTITVEMVGDTINAPTSPTRSGYTFGGWYTESECANQFDFTTPITATITLYAKWTQNTPPSGGGSYTPPKYPVTDTNQGEQAGGQIKLSKERAEAGDTVIITVTPDKGYENGNPVVLDTNKKPVEVTDNGNGTFSFKMPSGGVNVETKFSKIDYFDDVTENDWFDEASWYCAAHGLIQGTGHRQFDGHIGTNRAMLVTVLYRLANSTDDLESIFDDVESGKWYSEAIGWAAHNKIVEGYGNGKFGPDDTLTREQMVAVLYRYSMFMKYDVSKLNSLNTFTDADAISEWALQAMKWAAGNGIVEGIGNDLISPETGATRAQFAAMMQRFCANFVK